MVLLICDISRDDGKSFSFRCWHARCESGSHANSFPHAFVLEHRCSPHFHEGRGRGLPRPVQSRTSIRICGSARRRSASIPSTATHTHRIRSLCAIRGAPPTGTPRKTSTACQSGPIPILIPGNAVHRDRFYGRWGCVAPLRSLVFHPRGS